MLTDIVLFYILYTIEAPAWCYMMVSIRLIYNLIKVGVAIGKS